MKRTVDGITSEKLFTAETLRVTDVPTERLLARRLIGRVARDDADAELLLALVFGEPKEAPAPRGLRGRPVKPGRESAPKPARKRSACGTPPAYRRHLANGEEPCQPCRDAIAAARREARRAAAARGAGS